MKIIIVFFFIILSTTVNAQDYCKQVKKEVNNGTTFTYSSPYDTTGVPPVKVTRSYSTDTDLAFDNFIITFQLVSDLQEFYAKNPHGEGENDTRKFIIEFDDKSRIVDDSAMITYDPITAIQIVVRSISLNLEDKNINSFTNKNIAKYSFAGFEKVLTSDTAMAYKGYIQCIKNVHKL